jgi:hypothetical protein
MMNPVGKDAGQDREYGTLDGLGVGGGGSQLLGAFSLNVFVKLTCSMAAAYACIYDLEEHSCEVLEFNALFHVLVHKLNKRSSNIIMYEYSYGNHSE